MTNAERMYWKSRAEASLQPYFSTFHSRNTCHSDRVPNPLDDEESLLKRFSEISILIFF
jgi:hypothetical protein